MAPSTPPPPARAEFAALTMASAARRVISPSRSEILRPRLLFHTMLSITICSVARRHSGEVFIVNENVLKWGGIGIIGILAAVAVVLFVQRGAHLDLPGQFLKVRTAPLGADNAIDRKST